MRIIIFIAALLLAMVAMPAMADSFEGWKRASVDVDADGRVTAVELVDELSGAMATVMQQEIATWQFTPARIDGQAVSSRTHVAYALRAEAMDDDLYGVRIVDVSNGPMVVSKKGLRYPRQALRRELQGTVYLQVWIAADGSVSQVESAEETRAHRMLVLAAQKAVSSWRFKPEEVDGHPVAGRVVTSVQYCLAAPGHICERSSIKEVAGVPVRSADDTVALELAVALESDVEGRLLRVQ